MTYYVTWLMLHLQIQFIIIILYIYAILKHFLEHFSTVHISLVVGVHCSIRMLLHNS